MSKTQKNPVWLDSATKKIGIKEVKGSKHNPTIIGWLVLLKAWWKEDETPWCGTFVAICLKEVGLPIITHWYRALAWAEWGVAVAPCLGSLLVFGREGGGHVGWYVGQAYRTIKGKKVLCYRVRGGNQSDMVCDTWIEASRMTASRWPKGIPVTTSPVELKDDGSAISTNER